MVDTNPYLLLILINTLITIGIGMQSVDSRENGLPRKIEIGGRVHDEDYELDTSRRAQYSLLIPSRICRSESSIQIRVRVTGSNIYIDDVNSIESNNWCKHLNTQKASTHKPWELTAYAPGILTPGCMRGRNPRSSFTAKGDSLSRLYSSLTPKHKKGILGPDSPQGERPTIPVSS